MPYRINDKELLAYLLENSKDYLYTKDNLLRFTSCSRSFAKFIGKNHWQNLLGKTSIEVFKTKHASTYHEKEKKVLQEEYILTNHIEPYLNSNQQIQWLTFNKEPIYNNGKVIGLVAIGHPIEYNQETGTVPTITNNIFDRLTGLPNRYLFYRLCNQHIAIAKEKNQKIGTLFINLKNFAYINDHFGYLMGDRIILYVKEEIQKVLSKYCLFTRMDGDKFFILSPNIKNTQYLESYVHRILNQIEKPIQVENKTVYLSADIGISIYPDNSLNEFSLINQAETAMQRAKQTDGSKAVFYTDAIKQAVHQQREILQHLAKAIENDEFSAVFQPIVSLNNNEHKILIFEALARWHSNQIGTIVPSMFIPVAESSGLIYKLGQIVRKKAFYFLSQIKKSKQYDKDIKLSINLSVKELQEKKLLNAILDELEKYKLKPNDIIIEITEQFFLNDIESANTTLNRFKESGFSIAIDDFGTKYSCLSYLINYPFSIIKIDKEFTKTIYSNKRSVAVLKSIQVMADLMDMDIIIEGIETKEQLDFIKKLKLSGCGQGYFFSDPLTPKAYCR